MLKSALLKPAPIRKRLWQGGIALAILTMTIALVNPFLPAQKAVTPAMLGNDFLPFYTAGTLVRAGLTDLLYDLPTVRDVEHEIADNNGIELGKGVFGPFWNPPFYAWVFVPLSQMPYRQALLCWTMLNVAAMLTSILLMRRFFPADGDWRTTMLLPLLLMVSMPFIQAISHGQNTFMSLLLVAMTATAWRQRRAISAGIVCGLLLYKPQLAAILAIVMTFDLGWRVALATLCTLALLVIVTGLSLPGALDDYIHQLPINLHAMQIERTYLWERHVTFAGFWRLLLQGRGPGEMSMLVRALTIACSTLVGAGLLLAGVRLKRNRAAASPWTEDSKPLRRDRLIAATIASTPLLMPFYFDYDLLVLAVPAALLGAELTGRMTGARLNRADRWLLGSWSIMFLWMMVNPGVGGTTRVNGTVILLSMVAGLLIRRACVANCVADISADEATPHVTATRVAA